MMKIGSKLVLVAAVAALAFAGSAGDSVAKGKKKAAPVACTPGALTTAACGPAGCTMQRCWADGKWYPSLLACWYPWCPI